MMGGQEYVLLDRTTFDPSVAIRHRWQDLCIRYYEKALWPVPLNFVVAVRQRLGCGTLDRKRSHR